MAQAMSTLELGQALWRAHIGPPAGVERRADAAKVHGAAQQGRQGLGHASGGGQVKWLLIGLPVAFALGWMASRFDLRQLRRERQDSPRAYFKGLNLLLNEQGGPNHVGNYCSAPFLAVPAEDGLQLVPFAKAYSGLTDEEMRKVDAIVRKTTVEKFGPVSSVKPSLVFELGFEGIALSRRHKSGIAVRFPRMLRWRQDKTVEEADSLATLQDLLA